MVYEKVRICYTTNILMDNKILIHVYILSYAYTNNFDVCVYGYNV